MLVERVAVLNILAGFYKILYKVETYELESNVTLTGIDRSLAVLLIKRYINKITRRNTRMIAKIAFKSFNMS